MSLERQWPQVSFRKIGTIAVASAPLCAQKCASLYPLCRALGEAYDLFIVTGASGGVSVKAHAMAVRCMTAAGTVPHLTCCRGRMAARLGAGRIHS